MLPFAHWLQLLLRFRVSAADSACRLAGIGASSSALQLTGEPVSVFVSGLVVEGSRTGSGLVDRTGSVPSGRRVLLQPCGALSGSASRAGALKPRDAVLGTAVGSSLSVGTLLEVTSRREWRDRINAH